MKTKKYLLGAFCVALFSVAACAGLEPYTIDSPEDLPDKIAEYEAEKEAENQAPTDAIPIEVNPAVVGAEDNSSGWWTTWSQYFTVPVAKKLVVKFINYGGDNNWNNWVYAVSTAAERGADGYAEYFVLRADNWGWGNGDYSAERLSLDLDGTAPGDDAWWASFRDKMNGASVELSLDHASAGVAYLTVTSTALDGSVITETYNHPVSFTNDINGFFVADGAHIKIESAYLTSSDYPILPDSNPSKISFTGNPTAINYSSNAEDMDFWGNTVATVTFEDQSTLTVNKEDLVIVEPDLSTPGIKTVVATYSLTKKGVAAAKPAAGYYNFELIAGLEALEITKQPSHNTYIYYDNTKLDFRPYGIELQAKYDGGTVVPLTLDDVTISDIVLQEGEQDVTITYKPGSKSVSTTTKVNLVKGVAGIGVPEINSAWWTYFATDRKVPSGESVSYEMDVYSVAAENWQSPVAILRKADLSLGGAGEYAVVRIDNYGWGTNFVNDDANKESDWNWDLFKPMLNNAHIKITATNNGNNAVIRYDVLWANGEEHFQLYKNIAINDAEDVYLSFTVDNCYAALAADDYVEPVVPDEPETPTIASLSVTSQPTVNKYYLYDQNIALDTKGLEVKAIMTDNSSSVIPVSSLTIDPVKAVAGSQNVNISYSGVSTTVAVDVQIGSAAFGSPTLDNAWWTTFYPNEGVLEVPSGTTVTKQIYLYSLAALNHQHPVVVLTKEAASYEYLAVRMDNFGWGAFDGDAAYNASAKESDWNWDIFAASLNHSNITITIKNNGDDTADIRYDVKYLNGETHFQSYTGIPVEKDNVYYKFVTESSYAVVL